MKTNKVYTYYENFHKDYNDYSLIGECAKSWGLHGWDFELLTLGVAKQHLRFAEFEAKILTLPTVNALRYECSCYRRWLAFSVVGGGMIIDYDVFNYGFDAPFEANESTRFSTDSHEFGVPYFVIPEDKEKIVELILEWPLTRFIGSKEKPHCSDLTMMHYVNCFDWKRIPMCAQFIFNDDWRTAPMVHYSNGSVMQRAKLIPMMRSYVGEVTQKSFDH